MVNAALFVRLEAKAGKEADVAKFLRDGLAIVEAEPATTAWFRAAMTAPRISLRWIPPFSAARRNRINC